MKIIKKTTLLFLFFSLFVSLFSFAQDKITPPTEGKAVIYFLRTKSLGALMNFRFFEKNNYLGKFNGKNYIRYECDPGEHMFWVKAENIDFVKTNLTAGNIYLVENNAVMGGFSAGVKFRIVDYSNEKQMKRINKLLAKKEAKTFSKEQLLEDEKKMSEIIQKGMLKIQGKIKEGKDIKRITSDMNYKI